jgi:adenosylhomocysteine nucleosidase
VVGIFAVKPPVAIVAALEQEVRPLVKNWKRAEQEHQGRRFHFFESEHAVAVCGGIGAEAARRATEAVIAFYHPEEVWSVGFAGALQAELKPGALFLPNLVIDARDGSRAPINGGQGTLVTFHAIADANQKVNLGKAYEAQVVDMEAAAVARGAQKYHLSFRVIKVISDESNFALPAMDRFISAEGKFRTLPFATSAVLRPWLWAKIIRLAKNSSRAARSLCDYLTRSLDQNVASTSALQASGQPK